MKKTIVFDLGGVLLDWDPRHLYRKLFSDPAEMESFLERVWTQEWNARTDAELKFGQVVEILAARFPEYEERIQAYQTRWKEMISGEIRGTVELLRRLKEAEYPLAGLSNWSAETFPLVQGDYEFLSWLDPLVISGEVGSAKPDPEIYQVFLEQLDQPAKNCLFIDDRFENILEAKRQGFDTLLFTTPEALEKDLVDQGYL